MWFGVVVYWQETVCRCRTDSISHDFTGDATYQAQLVWGGDRGPPRYSITRDQLSLLQSCGFTARQMADILNVSASTVCRRLR